MLIIKRPKISFSFKFLILPLFLGFITSILLSGSISIDHNCSLIPSKNTTPSTKKYSLHHRPKSLSEELGPLAGTVLIQEDHFTSLLNLTLSPYVSKVTVSQHQDWDLYITLKERSYEGLCQICRVFETKSWYSISLLENSYFFIISKGAFIHSGRKQLPQFSSLTTLQEKRRASDKWFQDLDSKRIVPNFDLQFLEEVFTFNSTHIFSSETDKAKIQKLPEDLKSEIRFLIGSRITPSVKGWYKFDPNEGLTIRIIEKDKQIFGFRKLSRGPPIVLKTPFVTEEPKIIFIIPVNEAMKIQFDDTIDKYRIDVHLVLFDRREDIKVKGNRTTVHRYDQKTSPSILEIIEFVLSRLSYQGENRLLCTGESSMRILSPEYLNRVRMNTIPDTQMFVPVPFVMFNPEFITDASSGRFDFANRNHFSFYSNDISKVKSGNIRIFRAPEPKLILSNKGRDIKFIGPRSQLSQKILDNNNYGKRNYT